LNPFKPDPEQLANMFNSLFATLGQVVAPFVVSKWESKRKKPKRLKMPGKARVGV